MMDPEKNETGSKHILDIKREKLENLAIPTIEGFQFVHISVIFYLEAESSYTKIYMSDKSKIISSKNLGYYETELEAEPFLRIHHSVIINLNKVKSYVRGDEGYVILQNGVSLRVAKSKKDDLLTLFRGRVRK